jgi:hypothetical protein
MEQHAESEPQRELKIKWPKLDVTVTVRMHDLNTALVNLLWDVLPYRSLQTHALVTGDHLYHLVPSEPLLVGYPFSSLSSFSMLTLRSIQTRSTRFPTEHKSRMAHCFFPNFSIWP